MAPATSFSTSHGKGAGEAGTALQSGVTGMGSGHSGQQSWWFPRGAGDSLSHFFQS